MRLSHPETIPPTRTPRPRKHCLSQNQSLGPKKVGDPRYTAQSRICPFSNPKIKVSLAYDPSLA